MALEDDALVAVLVADYIGIDAGNKLNAVGVGFTLHGIEATGLSSPFSVAVLVDIPPKYNGHEFSVSLELHDDILGQVVQLTGPSGQLEAMRVQQVGKVEPHSAPPGVWLPQGMFGRVQLNLAFANGLPLKPGTLYSWRAELNGQKRKGWRAQFGIPGPPPPPVFGGPVGPTDIPDIPPMAPPGS